MSKREEIDELKRKINSNESIMRLWKVRRILCAEEIGEAVE
jgi:hypothetical protein